MTTAPTLFGARYSVYTRIARLTLAEKGADCRLEEVDVFAPGGPPPDHAARHPFGRIPALEHDGLSLYETGAIARYVDEAFPGPALQPADPTARARMNQIVSIMDSYAFRTLVWDVFVERVGGPARGRRPDEARIAGALPRAATILQSIDAIRGDAPWFAGAALSLADLWALPMLVLFRLAPEGADALRRLPRLTTWLSAMHERPSVRATRFPIEG
ncbi:glutathione S-transferase family protein [Desertibaculum subflavum]|uniref:glutathione S-transferase family protein n=1 Tax=Desertibaculum subflavum TaxID=2268458 RepID=UPI000E65FDFD